METLQTSPEQKTTLKTAVEVKNLRISFGEQQVLKDVSFKLSPGENLVILGESGSGKSVLIKCITRLLEPDAGEVTVLGKKVNGLSQRQLSGVRKKIGFLFQGGALYDSMTVRENLEFPLRRMAKRIKRREMDEKVKTALESVGLSDAINKMPSELSGGMRKRIALARSIIVEPEIIFYDEPTTGLDPINSTEISKLINKIQSSTGTSSIVITHDIDCARRVANRIIMLKDGEIFSEGEYEELKNSDNPWIKSFFGNS